MDAITEIRKVGLAEERCRQLLRSSSVALVVRHGVGEDVEIVNDSFTQLFGYTLEDMPDISHWWPLAYPDETYREAIKADWQRRVATAMTNRTEIEPMEAKVRGKDGSERYIEFHFSSVGDTNLVCFVDLTERKRAEESLCRSEERFRLAALAGRMFASEWDAATGVAVRSADFAQVLGIEEPVETNGQQILGRIHPDDRERVEAAFAALTPENPQLKINLATGDPYHSTF